MCNHLGMLDLKFTQVSIEYKNSVKRLYTLCIRSIYLGIKSSIQSSSQTLDTMDGLPEILMIGTVC